MIIIDDNLNLVFFNNHFKTEVHHICKINLDQTPCINFTMLLDSMSENNIKQVVHQTVNGVDS